MVWSRSNASRIAIAPCPTAAATRLVEPHLTRPAFYKRLRLIEHVLGSSLDSPESRTSLHVAVLALRLGEA